MLLKSLRRAGCALVFALAACTTSRVTVYPDAAPPAKPSGANAVHVAAGDTLMAISRKTGASVADLARWNCLASPYLIHPGQSLTVKAPASMPACATAIATAPKTTQAPTPTPAPTDVMANPVSTHVLAPDASPPVKANAGTTAPASTPSITSPITTWPASGAVLASRSKEPGLDIAGNAGDPVRAAGSGTVIYSGNGSPGYEEIIVIKHEGDWVSSYAHNRRRLVAEGRRVAAGEVIAEMGSTGVDRVMLHFEVRRDGTLIDPQKVLPRR